MRDRIIVEGDQANKLLGTLRAGEMRADIDLDRFVAHLLAPARRVESRSAAIARMCGELLLKKGHSREPGTVSCDIGIQFKQWRGIDRRLRRDLPLVLRITVHILQQLSVRRERATSAWSPS